MVEVSNVRVYDLVESVIASGNAMRINPIEDLSLYDEYSDEFKKGIKRMIRLVNSSKNSDVHCHDNALCGIKVSFDVKYPQYWTPEFQRYHFADIVTSSSKMHRLCKMSLVEACNKYVDSKLIMIAQEKVDNYNRLCSISNSEDLTNLEQERYKAFMEMVSNCPLGLELFMRVTTNYKQLQTIYYQRRHHKLKEDWQEGFCKNFVEKLPYFNELILGIDEETNSERKDS